MGYWKSTTCRQLSDYARTILLRKPVTVKYRNQSADELLSELIQLKNELHAIGANYNQAIHKLHTLDELPEVKIWLLINEKTKHAFIQKADEINLRMHQIYTTWSQK